MSQARILAIAFIIVGALLAVVSALADQIGLGAPGSTFGWKQLLGLVLGAIILVAGVILLRQPDQPFEEDEEYADDEYADEEYVSTEEPGEADRLAVGDDPATTSEQPALRADTGQEVADDVTDADADRTGRHV